MMHILHEGDSVKVATLENIDLYVHPTLTRKYVDAVKYWNQKVIQRDILKGLYPVWPAKFGFFERLKSFLGIYRMFGVMGFFSFTAQRIYIIVASHNVGLVRKLPSDILIATTAHEYQHAAFHTSTSNTVSLTKDFIIEWYKAFIDENRNIITPKIGRFIETKFVPSIIANEVKNAPVKRIAQLWSQLKDLTGNRVYDIIGEFITRGKISKQDYLSYIYIPSYKAYVRLLKPHPILKRIFFYQELFYPSEIISVRADVVPYDALTKKIAYSAKLKPLNIQSLRNE